MDGDGLQLEQKGRPIFANSSVVIGQSSVVHPFLFQASVALSPLPYHHACACHTSLLDRQSLRSSFLSVQACTALSTDHVPFRDARLTFVSKRHLTFFPCTVRADKRVMALATRCEHVVLALQCVCAQWHVFMIDWTNGEVSGQRNFIPA
jgi:hypothetical protein